ncbi:hypothetical protein HOP54_08845 [Halomonas daqingensis]|uniref:S24 family peptidase n=1 Tax=Billgrantia desiderata TaxID=52021 RepID=UPI00089F5801|nr:S24 family peptidase [Halomonas desiderata]MCE8028795.1 hypothetical protein [Halomonas desiderata]SEG44246.1 hypothetical protein SAMN04487953_13336 [Halomonas desiderata]
MRVNYLGPLRAGIHPAMEGLNLKQFKAGCYLVEVSSEAGVDGPIIEGDVLVVDESRPVGHADLVVAELDGEQRLFRTHRIGGAYRLMPTAGPRHSVIARVSDLRGVVVSQARRYAV